MSRYLCIHGHFYQPPREDPWTHEVPYEISAAPYHDWNERINVECYAPNAAAKVLDREGHVRQVVNNYSYISFNFGPTLLNWMRKKAPAVYQTILRADRESRIKFSGHGSAIAQGYNHIILPLANSRDKKTQILWGIRDFEHRFQRKPQGIWLPETAVDLETLTLAAKQEIKFTILSPTQAKRVSPLGIENWEDVSGGSIDPRKAYLLNLPSNKTISLFFYHAPVAQKVAFNRLLDHGETFVQSLLGIFSEKKNEPQLAHIATDGETYGHHHRFGEMALAYALKTIEGKKEVTLTNYTEFLDKHPPLCQVEIIENSSWSCVHGVERWRSDCGCRPGKYPEWNQAWRAPLRETFDWLRDSLEKPFEKKAKLYLKDPWLARDDFIDVILDFSSLDRFIITHATKDLSSKEKGTVLNLMELQHSLMAMYTSCGWFFDSSLELGTVQVLKYAHHAVKLAETLLDQRLEKSFQARITPLHI